MKNNGYAYDAISNTLVMTSTFAKRASQLNTPEYRIIRQLRMDNPGLTIERKSSNATHTRVGIKYADMEHYIKQCRNSEENLIEYRKIRALSEHRSSPYAFVRKWFDNAVPNVSEQPEFDEEGFVVEKPRKQQEPVVLPIPVPQETKTEETIAEEERAAS